MLVTATNGTRLDYALDSGAKRAGIGSERDFSAALARPSAQAEGYVIGNGCRI